jgi:hypothetical protein
MSDTNSVDRGEGLTLRQAALIAGFGYLLGPVTYAEFSIYPRLVVAGNIEQTLRNIAAHRGLFSAAILCYLIEFVEDIVIAWALYYLLVPVNRAFSLLAAWFRLMYTAIAFFGMLKLVAVFDLVTSPEYVTAFGVGPLQAQVRFYLGTFRDDWSIGLVLFGIHLLLLGILIYRSGYIPRLLGILVVIDGCGWVINSLQPYLSPLAHLRYLFLTFFGEVFLMLWLLVRGWRIQGNERASIPALGS